MFRRYFLIGVSSIALFLTALAITQPSAGATNAGEQIEVTGGSALPVSTVPPDVMTFKVNLGNNARRVENLEVRIKVIGPQGSAVLQTQQSGVKINDKSTQSVYWVWRTPANLAAGNYNLVASVIDKTQNKVLVEDKNIATFQLSNSSLPRYQ